MFSKSATSGTWNGKKVEFGKVYGNPMVNAFAPQQPIPTPPKEEDDKLKPVLPNKL